MFLRFTKLNQDLSQLDEHVGLNLCYRIAQIFSGDLKLFSQIGIGSQFNFTFQAVKCNS